MSFYEAERLKKCILKITSAIIILLASFSLIGGAFASEPEPTVEVLPYANFGHLDEFFTVNITILEVQNLYGIEVKLYWNSEILAAVDVDVRLGEPDGVLYKPIFTAENSTGEDRYILAATSTSGTPFYGSGNVVRITFRILSLADSRLDLQTQLYDYPPPDREPRISLPIEHDAIDGFFDVTPPIIGSPTRSPSADINPWQPVKVMVNVTDSASGVKNATLLYTANNGSTWNPVEMLQNSTTKLYEAMISPQLENTEVRFRIVAYDFAENTQMRDGTDPCCTYTVIPEILSHSLLLFIIVTALAALCSKKIPRSQQIALR